MERGNGAGSRRAESTDDDVFSAEDLVAAMDTAARQLVGRGGVEQAAERIVAGAIAATLYGAREVSHLNRALASRDEIGQAEGILMERFSLTGDAAFDLLVRSSQDTNVKLATVARFLTDEVSTRSGSVRASARATIGRTSPGGDGDPDRRR